METVKSVRHSIVNIVWAVSIDLSDAYLHVPIHPQSRKYLRFIHEDQIFQFYGLTLRNVPKFVDFYQIDGSCIIVSTSMCHLSFSVPRRLADKKSDSQSITVSDKILPSSNSESGFYCKPKKVRINTCSEIHVQRHGISDTAEFNQGSSGMSQDSNIDCRAIKYHHKLSFLFWANSVQQQISLS